METPDSVQVFSDKYLENISDAFKNLYNEEQLSDVTIYCREGSLKAHKLILAASSPYFYKIFRENRNEFPILILHGTSLNQMKNLIDLLYSGITDVKNDDIEALYTLVKDFEIKGVSFGPKSSASNVRLEMNSNNVSSEGSHNRDTRFKGQKRVAVDYIQDEISRTHLPSTSRADNLEEVPLNKKPNLETIHTEDSAYVKREITSPAPTESTILSSSDTIISSRSLHSYSENKLSAWAKKQRKFKCDLCPSSFKRSSHLSRHQLVHTGERPYSCDKCDKAFSRHDKLKHHMRKAHEFIPDSMYERIDNDPLDSDVESNNINYASPNHNESENGLKSEYCDLSSPKSTNRETSPLFTISHISSILEDSFVNPPKKGRGRPRKYPPPTVSPAVLNSNQELPISNDMKANEKVDNSNIIENGEKAKKYKKKSKWFEMFEEENKNITTSRVLRKKRNVNNNEDSMFFRKAEEALLRKDGLFCEICDKSFIYQGRLKLHMKKLHGIIDNSQIGQLISSNIQKDDLHNISPPVEAEKDISFPISNVCSLNDSKNQNLEDRYSSSAGDKSTENFTYEQLRELLPKECTLQPIVKVDVNNSSQNDIGEQYFSDPLSTNVVDHGAEQLTQGSHLLAMSSLLEGETHTTIEEKKETPQDVEQSHASKISKIYKKNRRKRRKTKYTRVKNRKPKIDQPASKHAGVKWKNAGEDLSITVIGASDECDLNSQTDLSPNQNKVSTNGKNPLDQSNDLGTGNPLLQCEPQTLQNRVLAQGSTLPKRKRGRPKREKPVFEAEFADYDLNSQSELRPKPRNLSTEGKKYIAQSENYYSTTPLQCEPQMTQGSQLPKKNRGRPKRETSVVGKNTGEDLSITVIGASDECDPNSQSELSPNQNKVSTNGKNPLDQGNDLDTGNPLLQCEPQMPQNSVVAQDSTLPKRKRGRPKRENPVFEKKIPEDLSIIVINTSDEAEFAECDLNSQSELRPKPSNLSTEGKKYLAQSENYYSTPLLQCEPQITQNSVLTLGSQLPKRNRGRPKRETSVVVAPIVKRGRGRPRCNVYPGRPGVQNYNITNLPYGDLNYLTSQTSTGDDEEASVMMEPLVEINMDQSEQSDSSQNIRRIDREENTIESSRMMEPVVIEPVLQIAEQNVKTEQSDDGNISQEEIDISEIKSKIGLIGECTISVAN